MSVGRSALLCLVAGALGACAALPPGKRDARDPFERFNRGMYRFNVQADRAVLRPVARGWRAAVPRPVRLGVHNFVDNLGYPTTIINDVLQGKLGDGGRDFTRLIINTVCGFGFVDVAIRAGLEHHQEDFGQTLGKWGIHAGPYLMLPLLGPSTLRDAPALLVDDYTDVRHYFSNKYAIYGVWAAGKAEQRAQLLDADAVLDRTFDPYSFVRNAWLQRREYLVHDGQVSTAADTDSPLDDSDLPPDAPPDASPGEPPATAPGTSPPAPTPPPAESQGT